jgi:hypothetical protein
MTALIILLLCIHNLIEKTLRPITIFFLRFLKIIYPVLAITILLANRQFFVIVLVYAGAIAVTSFIETLLKNTNIKAQASFQQNNFLLVILIFLVCSPLIKNNYLTGLAILYCLFIFLIKKIAMSNKKERKLKSKEE